MSLRPASLAVITLLALGLAVAGCGKKAGLKPPKGEESNYTYPAFYPDPETVNPQDTREAKDENAEQNLESEVEPGFQSSPLLNTRSKTQTYGSQPE